VQDITHSGEPAARVVFLFQKDYQRYNDGNMSALAAFQILPHDYYPISEAMAATPKSHMGRPHVMTKPTISKLRLAFLVGCSEREACIFAGIHRLTLYRYQDKNPDFCDQKQAWQTYLVLQARFNIAEAIRAGDVQSSWRYLRAKHPEEFGV